MKPTSPAGASLRDRIQSLHPVRAALCLGAAALLALSLGHHLVNLWGLGWKPAAAVGLGGSAVLAVCLYWVWTRVSSSLKPISAGRWAFFIVGALVLGGIGAARFFVSPLSWHRLEIVSDGSVTLLEIKAEGAEIAPFDQMKPTPGWQLIQVSNPDDGGLTIRAWQAGDEAEPLVYSFQGPSGKAVTLLFETSPASGAVSVRLDGIETQTSLSDARGGQREVRLSGRYRGLPNQVFLPMLAFIDVLAFSLLVLAALLAQERGAARMAETGSQSQVSSLPFRSMGALTGLAAVLHLLNALAVPLVLDVDSPTYLSGAVQWLAQGNLNGVAAQRGPGTTFLFAPVLLLWGRDPWGMKLLLHLLGVGCVPLAFWLGWLASEGLRTRDRRRLAFLAGLAGALTPDLYFYSNYVMSDLANVFFGLLFLCLLLKALRSGSLGWQAAALLTGSFATLLRSENSTALAAGAAFLALKAVTDAAPAGRTDRGAAVRRALRSLGTTALSCALAALPLLGWSIHNLQANGFFGLSNYSGAVLYDGWVFFGEASHLPVTDFDSPGIQAVQTAYSHQGTAAHEFSGDTWDDFAALRADGYTSEQAYAVMQRAALDSIRKDPRQTLKLLAAKIEEGLEPVTTATHSFPLPGETPKPQKIKAEYFDSESLQIEPLIRAQRAGYAFLDIFYGRVYPAWVWMGMAALLLSAFRRPFYTWAPLAAMVLLKVIFPLVIGFGMWRYVVAGIVPLEILAFATVQALAAFVKEIANRKEIANERMSE